MKNELLLPYKLEQHLNEICTNNPAYENLLSVWNINKKTCQDVLSTVIVNYPHYTKHDISHCETIITNIEMLLGEEALRTLSPTDTWLLLHAAYLHDIGMVIECRRIEENWETEEFQNYLHELENSTDVALAENAKYINSLGDKIGKKEQVMSWPVRVRYAVTLIIADYYRKRHASEADSYIKDMGTAFHIDLGYNGLIQQRLLSLLGTLVGLHTEPREKILELDYRTNGYNADYSHPRFLEQMLRMGDLLDADNNRFNSTSEFVFGKIPDSSKKHWEKHISANHILITPDVIEYRANCGRVEVYRETRMFLSLLKDEVEFWALNWKKIMPENINGSAPRLGQCELLLNGIPDIQGLSDLRFSISPEKAFEVIEGSNIYEDRFVFLREVVQNALDACKIQLWRDISDEKYKSWIACESGSEIQPFAIDHKVFENYGVEVRLCEHDEDYFKIIIKDNGIGLSAEQLKKICNVGVSYSGDKKRKEEINRMPLWLWPTAGFGIGLQSIFLVAEEFEIYSKTSGGEGIHARVASRRKNGYVQIAKSDKLKTQGTEIHIILSRDMNFKYGFVSNTCEYIETEYDPFSSEKNLLYYKIWDALRETVESTYFPIRLYFDNRLVDIIGAQEFSELEECSADSRYRYKILPNYEMKLWDNKTYTRIRIRLQQAYQRSNNRYFFKGMEMRDDSNLNVKGIWFEVDFYGLDTKKTLALDRKRIRKEALGEIDEILDAAIQFYLKSIENVLFEERDGREEREYNQLYTYWCMVPLRKKMDLLEKHKNVFKNIQVSIDILSKNADNKFSPESKDFKEVVNDLENTAVIRNLTDYIEHRGSTEKVKTEQICSLLDQKDNPFEIIILNKDFTEVLDLAEHSRVLIITDTESKIKLYLQSYTIQEKKLPMLVDEDTKAYLFRSLFKTSGLSSLHVGFMRSSVRRYILAIEGYEEICTKMVPFGIDGEWYRCSGYIISPFTVKQWKNNKHLDEEKFVEFICKSDEFSNLVDHVFVHQLENDKFTKEAIENKYRKFIREMYRLGISQEE